MTAAKIEPGQVWRSQETREDWLVTKVYSEAFASYAMLRKVGEPGNVCRVKIANLPQGITLRGFTYTQGLEEF